MKTIDKYRFLLVASPLSGGQASSHVVTPQFSKFSISDRKERDSWIYSRSTDCEMTFVGDDADIIIGNSVFYKYELHVYDSSNSEVVVLRFKKTDCAIDVNHRRVVVTPYVEDAFKRLADGLDNEYNLVDIIPADYKQDITFLAKPTVQRYIFTVGGGDKEIHLYSVGGVHKSEVTPPSDVSFIRNDKFGFKVCFTAYCDSVGNSAYNKYKGKYASTCRQYENEYGDLTGYYNPVAINTNNCTLSMRAEQLQGQEVIYYFRLWDENNNLVAGLGGYTLSELLNLSQLWFSIQGYGIVFTVRVYAVCCRCLNNVSGTDVTDTDLYPASYLYRKPLWLDAVTSSNVSNIDTGYGKVGNTSDYYDVPDSSKEWIPAYQESWHNGLSLWLIKSPLTDNMIGYTDAINKLSSSEVISDFYKLTDVIRHILAKIDEDIVFTDDSDHSQFLTAANNPVTGIQQGLLYITQKSNLLNYHYDYPAWKAPCKLSQIFTLLRNAFNCQYDIYTDSDGQKHLRIEHILFYLNGYSYSSSNMSLINLKSLQDGRNGKPFSFLSNNWKYKTDSQPIRYEFSWMDTQSEAFAGFPIEVPAECRIFTTETTESRTIDWFSTDFDFLMSVPSECSSDGFVLAETENINSHNVTNEIITYKDKACLSQNSTLAFVSLHPNFMPYNMYADKVNINDEDTDVVVRKKASLTYNEVFFRTDTGMVTPMNSIMTECGTGIIEELSYDLTSQQYTATINYDIQ